MSRQSCLIHALGCFAVAIICAIFVFGCSSMGIIEFFKEGFKPMVGGKCIDNAIIEAKEIEANGGKTVLVYGKLKNGAYHIHTMRWDGKDYKFVFPDPGFDKIDGTMSWRKAEKLWRK